MRIAYLAPNIPVPGTHGGSTHVTSVYRQLSRRHQVLLLCRRGSTQPHVLPIGHNLHPLLQQAALPYSFARALPPIKRFAPDIIYERYSAFGLGPALARALRIPCVLMTLDRDASPLSFHYADRIVATSDAFIPSRYHAKLSKVHWGVDTAGLEGQSGDAVRSAFAQNGEHLVLYTGSFPRWHGVDIVVDIAKHWSGPPVVFVLVGDGQDRRRVQTLAWLRGLKHRIVFAGRVPHDKIGAFIAASDVCIAPYAPSRHPVFRKHGMNRDPIKVLEYMALGKVTLTIDIPRMRELFVAGEQVLLYPPEDPKALGALLSRVLLDKALAERVGQAGQRLVRSQYTWAHHAMELEAVFTEVLEERR